MVVFASGAVASAAAMFVFRSLAPQRTVRLNVVDAATIAESAARNAEAAATSAFARRTLTHDELRLLFPDIGSLMEYDPQTLFRYRANVEFKYPWREHPQGKIVLRTNSLGLREEREVSATRPDLRILVTGDSHTDGVCGAEETFVNVLERRLAAQRPGRSVEALNAAVGGYGFYNYLGALERYLPLAPDVFVVAVYGGNDFEDALTLYHYFRGSARPAGTEAYREQVERATNICEPAMSQGLLQAKYFAAHPDEVEVALQAASEVTGEMLALCERSGVRPIVVYLPSLIDVAVPAQRDEIAGAERALELTADDLEREDRMADRYVEFVRSTHARVLDLRPAFRASSAQLYWRADRHIDLAAHELIAGLLEPLVDAALAGDPARRPDAGPSAAAIAPANPIENFRDTYGVHLSGKPLARPAFERGDVEVRFELRGDHVYDAQTLFRYSSNLAAGASDPRALHTNALGLLGEHDPRTDAALPRIVIAGDEMLFAPGDAGPALGARIEDALRAPEFALEVECLDACTAGYGFYNALGVVEKLANYSPRAVVIAVDAANDFADVIDLYRAVAGESRRAQRAAKQAGPQPASRSWIESARRLDGAMLAPRTAIQASVEITLEIARRCRELGAEPVIVLIPPPSDPRAVALRESVEADCRSAGLELDALRSIDRVEYVYRDMLAERGVAVIDFGVQYEQHGGEWFDRATWRLGETGRQALTETVVAALAPALKRR